jgi:hypothetical protein
MAARIAAPPAAADVIGVGSVRRRSVLKIRVKDADRRSGLEGPFRL